MEDPLGCFGEMRLAMTREGENLVFAILNRYPLGQGFGEERGQVTAEADDAAVIIFTRPNRLNAA